MTAHVKRVVALGECMIELREIAPRTLHQSFGGDTLNTAVYLSRLAGAHYQVGYATALGQSDHYSQQMQAEWAAEGIELGWISHLSDRVPGLYTIQVDEKGERSFAYWRSHSAAKAYFDGAASPLEANLDDVDVLYLSGISLAILPDAGRARLLAAMKALRERGAWVVFDNNYRPRLWSSRKEALACYDACYQLATHALITLDDEMAVREQDAKAALASACALPCPEVIIKRGAEPCLIRTQQGQSIEVASTPVPRVVDTTAAGDSFGAGYLAARLRGLDEQASARAGHLMAGTVIQHPGAIITPQAMPSHSALFAPTSAPLSV